MENIEQRVKKIVAEQIGVNEADIKTESAFVEALTARQDPTPRTDNGNEP